VNGAIAVTLCCKAATAAAGLWLNRAWVRFPSRMRYAGELALYAAPFGIACLLGAAMPAVERAAIGGLLGADQIGLYAGAAKVAAMVALFVGAFETAWGPFHLAIHRDDGAQRTFNVVLDLLTTALCATCLLLAAASPWLLPLLASSRFAGASVAVFPLAMAVVTRAIGWVLAIGIGISMKSRWSLVGEAIGAIASIAGIVALTRVFGITGTGFGVLGGQLAKTAACYWAAQRAHPMQWSLRMPVIIGGLAVTGGGIATAVAANHSAAAGSGVFACTAACVLAVSLGRVGREEWAIARRLVLRRGA
jgi:O-antigen/teichoic acid export membrane protein